MKKYIIIFLLLVIVGAIIIGGCKEQDQDSNIPNTPIQLTAYSELSSDGNEYEVYVDSSKKEKVNFSKCLDYTKVLLKNYIVTNFETEEPKDVNWVVRDEKYAIVYYLVDEQWYVFKLQDDFKKILKEGERPYCGVIIKSKKEVKDNIDYLEKNSIKDRTFVRYLHKWSKISIQKVLLCESEDEHEYKNIYFKSEGKWYFCRNAISLKTIKENKMLDDSIIEKIEKSIK